MLSTDLFPKNRPGQQKDPGMELLHAGVSQVIFGQRAFRG